VTHAVRQRNGSKGCDAVDKVRQQSISQSLINEVNIFINDL